MFERPYVELELVPPASGLGLLTLDLAWEYTTSDEYANQLAIANKSIIRGDCPAKSVVQVRPATG
jgi:hypothetical protein